MNGIHCRSGYIIIKKTKNIENIQCNQGIVHGKCYKSVFGCDIDTSKVVGGGFAYNSYSFNVTSEYHDSNKGMHEFEKQCILAAINNWKQGIQNTLCKNVIMGGTMNINKYDCDDQKSNTHNTTFSKCNNGNTIKQWLKKHGFEKYYINFTNYGIGQIWLLQHLTKEDLKYLYIGNLVDKMKLWKLIQQYQLRNKSQ